MQETTNCVTMWEEPSGTLEWPVRRTWERACVCGECEEQWEAHVPGAGCVRGQVVGDEDRK